MTGVLVAGITKNNYSILATVDVTKYKSLGDLYGHLLSLKKEVFQENERIVVLYSTDKQLELIKELVITIDIPDFFVIFERIESTENSIDFNFSDSFCIYPWINLRINTLGGISPCCKFDTTGLTENINSDNIKELYLGKSMSALREDLRHGRRPTQCNACWKEESVGIESMRQRAKYKFREIYNRLDYQTDSFDNLQLFDLNLGNACNLSCRICHHTSSSSIADLDLRAGRLTDKKFIELKHAVNWSETTEFWDQLVVVAQNLKYLDLYGGEPLMSKNHFNFLRKLIDLGVAGNIQIDYNSNGTIFSEKFFDLWNHFKSVKISFSIDDIEDRFEYQRNGANWTQVNENIRKYCAKVSDKFNIDIFPTINIQNVYYLPELLLWAQTINLTITFSILHFPNFLSIQNIPHNVRATIIAKLKPFVHYDVITAVINILEQPTNCDGYAFNEYMKTLDRERSQRFQQSHKEIAELMSYGS